MTNYLTRFTNPSVRDLAWTIASPLLLKESDSVAPCSVKQSWCDRAFQSFQPHLCQLDDDPAPLESWLTTQKGHRLGLKFEMLIEYWLRHWSATDLLSVRENVANEERTLGEFDFLFNDTHRHAFVHWETAVKFYLRYQARDGRYHWVGPNPRDTLERKVNKVFDHQLRMGLRAEAAAVLKRFGISELLPEAFVKGWLFYPSTEDWKNPDSVPNEIQARISVNHLKGWWTAVTQANIPQLTPASRWIVLPRLSWLAHARASNGQPGYDHGNLKRMLDHYFSHSAKPLLIAELSPSRNGVWTERSRGFVVPEHWPRFKRR